MDEALRLSAHDSPPATMLTSVLVLVLVLVLAFGTSASRLARPSDGCRAAYNTREGPVVPLLSLPLSLACRQQGTRDRYRRHACFPSPPPCSTSTHD
jgi:hypothetical protein